MKFNSPYWSTETKIRMLQRWILVQSFIYYKLNQNIVSDFEYDKNTQQLIQMQKENSKVKTEFSYVFKDFNSGTGFDLIMKLKDEHYKLIEQDANIAIKKRR